MNPLGCNTLKIEAEAKALALYASSWRGKSDVTLSFSSWRGEGRAARSSSYRSCTIVILSKSWSCSIDEAFKLEYKESSMKPLCLNMRDH